MQYLKRKKHFNKKDIISVLYVHLSLDIGGAQAVRYMFLKYLNQENLDITLCCLGEKGMYGERLEKLGYEVRAFKRPYRLFNLTTTLRLYNFIKKRNFDIVHSSLFFSNYHAALAALMAGVPFLVTEEHGEHKLFLKVRHLFYRVIGHFISKVSDLILCCSDRMKQEVAKAYNVPLDKLYVLKNMIDDRRLEINYSREEMRDKLAIPHDALIIGTVGSLSKIKNQKFMIDSFAQLSIQNSFFVLVGDGPLREELTLYVSKLGLGLKVRFTGWREDVADILNTFDIFVLTSISEGLPISLLEAMSVGLPCIANRVGGIPEILSDNITGKLVYLNNRDEFLKAVNWMVCNPKKAKELGSAARSYVLQKFQPLSYAMQLVDLYKNRSKPKLWK